MLNQQFLRFRQNRLYHLSRIISVVILLVALSLGGFGPALVANADDWPVQKGGYVPPELAGKAVKDGASFLPNGSDQLEISLALNPRNYTDLWALVDAQADPASLHYHAYLTSEQFIDRFSPSQADYDATLDWLKANGFTITRTYPNRMLVDALAPVANITKAFNTGFGTYYDSFSKKEVYAVTTNPSLPGWLANKVNFIGGLTNRKVYRTQGPQAPEKAAQQSAEQVRRDGFTPQQIRKAYGSESLIQQGITGKGLTLGIVLFDAYFEQSDLDAFSATYGLPKKNVTVVGTLAQPGTRNFEFGGYAETNIDLQWSHASAPDADIILYSQLYNSDADIIRMLQSFANDGRADVASLSWGGPESAQNKDYVKAADAALLQAAVQGTSIFVASGDSGIFNEARYIDQGGDPNKVTGDHPSGLPFVTAVGGTTLKLNPDGSIASEVGWSIEQGDKEKLSSGGGKSEFYERPAYQRNFNPTTQRGTPDISANGDPKTPYNLYIQPRFAGSSLGPGIFAIGNGTSNSSPVWAGFCTLLAQQAGGRLGLINYALYDLNFSVTRDILQGFNGESARPGWDFVTGLGVARVDQLARFFPSRTHNNPLPPGATVFERVNPNLSVVPGSNFTVIVGIRNNTDVPMTNPTVTLPIPAGARLVNAQFTGDGAAIASQDGNQAVLNYGAPIAPYQNATGFITLQAPDAPNGTTLSHRSTVSWNQNGNQVTMPTNSIDLALSDTNQTDGSQDGLLGGFLSRDEGSGDYILRDSRFGPGENWSAFITDNKGNQQPVPDGRVSGGPADGSGKVEIRIATKSWPNGSYTLLFRGNNTGIEVVANFNVG